MEHDIHERRKDYFIKKEFQIRFIIKFCLLVILGTLILGSIVYLMSSSTVTTTFVGSRLKITNTGDFIMPVLLLGGAIVIIAIGLATIAVTLFTSHKIAGPLYHLEKDLDRLAQGDFGVRFDLRKNDELQRLRNGLNLMAKSLSSVMADVRKAVADIEPRLNGNAEAKNTIEDLKKKISRFNS